MTESLAGIASKKFSYLDEPPSTWAEALGELKRSGITHVESPILWGAHESLQGVRDFTKCSRLRLERFFTLAHAQKLAVDVTLGFPPALEAFPAWTMRLAHKAWIPTSVWSDASPELTLTEIPSFFDRVFSDGFVDFLEELLPILTLYKAPEGPLRSIRVDLGIYECDMNVAQIPEYVNLLASRYPSIEEFNLRYQTAYRQFAVAASRQALRTLGEKRAWLAAFDYQWCRRRLLKGLIDRITDLPSFRPLSELVVLQDGVRPHRLSGSAWTVVMDGVLVEGRGGPAAHLFSPGGIASPGATGAFRLAHYFLERCAQHDVPVEWLPCEPSGKPYSSSLLVVVAGRYLSKSSFEVLNAHREKGGDLFFPFGLAQYDEDMCCHGWTPSGERRHWITVGEDLAKLAAEATSPSGGIFEPLSPLDGHAESWDAIRRMATAIVRPREANEVIS